MADIAIQIVNYKTRNYLEVLLESLLPDLASLERSWEVFVLDNASGDDLSDLAATYEGRRVHFATAEKNTGFGGGHNELARMHQAPLILLLNPDLRLIEPHTVERLVAVLEETGAAVVGPKLLSPRWGADRSPRGKLSPLDLKDQGWDHGTIGRHDFLEHSERVEAKWVSGAVFLIRRDAFDAAGGFDENFFLYKEEEDLCLRIRRAGGKVLYEPDVKVLHIGSVVASKNEHMHASNEYFRQKHGGDVLE